MSKENCVKKGYHEFSGWRRLENSRLVGDMNGTSYRAVAFDYYIRNCKCCDAIEAASNLHDKELKTLAHKKLVLARKAS